MRGVSRFGKGSMQSCARVNRMPRVGSSSYSSRLDAYKRAIMIAYYLQNKYSWLYGVASRAARDGDKRPWPSKWSQERHRKSRQLRCSSRPPWQCRLQHRTISTSLTVLLTILILCLHPSTIAASTTDNSVFQRKYLP